jgi:hypothetical protein
MYNEARNHPYSLALVDCNRPDGTPVWITVTLDDPKDAKAFDQWIKKQMDNTIAHADGGPNEIEF